MSQKQRSPASMVFDAGQESNKLRASGRHYHLRLRFLQAVADPRHLLWEGV
jgi:hypothetical protein